MPHLGADIGFGRPKFETAFSFRWSYVNRIDDSNFTAFEPAWTIRFGGERFKFHTQLGMTMYRMPESSNFTTPTFSLGMTARLKSTKK